MNFYAGIFLLQSVPRTPPPIYFPFLFLYGLLLLLLTFAADLSVERQASPSSHVGLLALLTFVQELFHGRGRQALEVVIVDLSWCRNIMQRSDGQSIKGDQQGAAVAAITKLTRRKATQLEHGHVDCRHNNIPL